VFPEKLTASIYRLHEEHLVPRY